ncbi:restriction endonuclease [Flavobacterium sp. 2]|uniref:restriction endonuclease n=1 Tax=Flavobacterium sp. 2 TaxID=308053 RepID=UPI003CFB1D8E
MDGTNTLDWKTYESITKYIYETLGKQTGVKVKGYGSSCKVIGKSGLSHQIDVLTSHSDGIHSYDTAIECKYWKEKVNKDIVMKVSEIIEDANINKGVIVSKGGFTQDGINFAKYRNIGLVELREINDEDLQRDSREIYMGQFGFNLSILITSPVILTVGIGNNRRIEFEHELDFYEYLIILNNGKQVLLASFAEDFRREVGKGRKNKLYTKCREIPGSTLVHRVTCASVNLDEITFTGKLTEVDASRKIEVKLTDKVWLIMKSIFEERVFTFSHTGIITEYKK